MNFVKKVFEGNIDESVHLQFQKFSKGEFRNRALIKLKKTGGRYKKGKHLNLYWVPENLRKQILG